MLCWRPVRRFPRPERSSRRRPGHPTRRPSYGLRGAGTLRSFPDPSAAQRTVAVSQRGMGAMATGVEEGVMSAQQDQESWTSEPRGCCRRAISLTRKRVRGRGYKPLSQKLNILSSTSICITALNVPATPRLLRYAAASSQQILRSAWRIPCQIPVVLENCSNTHGGLELSWGWEQSHD